MIRFVLAVFAVLVAAPAQALTLNGVALDPKGLVRPMVLEQAVAVWRAHPETRRDVLVVADMGRRSTEARFAIVDLTTGAVEALRTAHGRGSDPDHDGLAQTFSDDPGSLASSLGAYATGGRYIGKHGLSLKLKGLDPTNANAEARAIVLHSADYMTPAFIAAHGRPGRSWGCFVVAPNEIQSVVDRLEGGVLIVAVR